MTLEIKKTDDPILRQATEKVENFGMEIQTLIDGMIETMRANKGIGLAAPQVGVSKKILVCEFEGDADAKLPNIPLTVVCNPEIISNSKELKNMVEGCLSFPNLELLVKRPKKVTVKGHDRYGNPLEIEAEKLHSRVLQHEIDHLNSILFIDHLQEMSVVFIGSGTLGVPALKKLAADKQYKIKLVITGQSESVSRQSKGQSPIEETAKELNLPILKTKNINDPKVISQILSLKADIGVMADFGQIVKKEILDAPKHGVINIHPSLLPRHRGPSPLQQTLLDGDKITGVTLILANEKMDAGDIVSQSKVKLSGSETTPILKEYLSEMGANLLLNSIPYYLSGDLKPEPQNNESATYNHLFKMSDGEVTLETPTIEVERKVRAFADWPKVHIIMHGKRIQLISAHFDQEGNLVLDLVKPEGKKEMTYAEYLRGYKTKIEFK